MAGSGVEHGATQPRRLSTNDLTMLATDRGPAPMNIAAVLRISPGQHGAATGHGLEDARDALVERLAAIPRFRQRVVREGRLRPTHRWVDEPDFDLARHVVDVRGIESEEALLDVVARLVCAPLPRDRPLWRLAWATGLADGSAALVLVLHHVVTDGMGGIAALMSLADSGVPTVLDTRSATDARANERSLRPQEGRGRRHSPLSGLRELGLIQSRPRLAERTAYNVPSGPRRRLTTVTVPLADVVRTAHARRCTVNDIVVCSVVGAMAARLAARGEHPRAITVSVPISGRRAESAGGLGNANGVVPVRVPTWPDAASRLREITSHMEAHRATGTPLDGARATSSAPMGLAFRFLARLGIFQAFIDRQRLVNTFVTNMRGPATPLTLGGHRLASIVPVAVTPGNVGVTFDVLSYAGQLVVTVVADPDVVTDQDALTQQLEEELRSL